MGMGFDRPLTDVEQLGSLRDRQFEDVPAGQHLALASGQRAHDCDHGSGLVAADHGVLRTGLVVAHEHERPCGTLGDLTSHP